MELSNLADMDTKILLKQAIGKRQKQQHMHREKESERLCLILRPPRDGEKNEIHYYITIDRVWKKRAVYFLHQWDSCTRQI